MKKLFFLLTIYMILGSIIYGQLHAVYIPEEKLNKIKIDGDINDWNWVPEKYKIKTENMKDVLSNSDINYNNWNCSIIVGWNDIKNWIYIVAVVKDNICNADKIINNNKYISDNLIFSVNANKYYYKISSGTRILGICNIPADTSNKIIEIVNGPKWLENNPQFIQWNYKIEKTKADYEIVQITYELGMQLWNLYSTISPEYSYIYNLSSYQNIRLTIGFDDIDGNKKAQWIISNVPTDQKWLKQTQQLSNFVLDPPIICKNTWEKIYILTEP